MIHRSTRSFTLAMVILWTAGLSAANLPDLLIRHRDALGGAEAIQKIRTLHRTAEVQIMSMQGLLDEWSAVPDKYRMFLKTPVMTQTQGRDGLLEWTLDHNNQVNTQNLDMPENAVWAQVLPEFQYLFPGTGANPRDLGEVTVDGRTYRVLEVRHLDRTEPSRLYLDPDTYLTVFEEGEEEGMAVTVEYKDYRSVEGIMMPRTLIQTLKIAGMPPTIITVKDVFFNIDLEPDTFQLPGRADTDYRFPENTDRVTVPVYITGEHILIDVRVNGEGPFKFLLDSGAATSLLDKQLAQRLGLDMVDGMKAVGIGGAEDLGAARVEHLSIGGFEMTDLNLFATDLTFIGNAMQTPMDGIIGYDLFARSVVRLNYATRKLTIFDPDHFEYTGNGDKIPGEIRSNLIHIEGRIDDVHTGWLRVDTGAGGAVHLHGPFVEKNGLMDAYQPHYETEAAGAGGSQTVVIARARSIQLGTGYMIRNPLVSMPKGGNGGAMTMVDSIATIGNSIWSRFTVYFDYGHKQLILESNDTLFTPMVFNRCGFTVTYSDGYPTVQHVFPGRQGETAGIQPGDLILKINKLKTSEVDSDTVQAMLEGPENTRIKLKLERDGRKFTRRITLNDYL